MTSLAIPFGATSTAKEALSLFWPGASASAAAAHRLWQTVPLIGGFFLGCAVGAAGAARLGQWAWAIPALLSLLALPLASRAQTAPAHAH